MLNTWTQGPLDIERFVLEYEKFVENQEEQVMPGDYVVCPEFVQSMMNFELDYATKTNIEKDEIHQSLTNVLIDPVQYREIAYGSYCCGSVENKGE